MNRLEVLDHMANLVLERRGSFKIRVQLADSHFSGGGMGRCFAEWVQCEWAWTDRESMRKREES